MYSLTIRREAEADIPAIRALYAQPSAYANTLQLPWPSLQRWERFLGNPADGFHSLVACRDGRLLGQLGLERDAEIAAAATRYGEAGQAAIYLVENDRVLAVFAVADKIRPESFEAVRRLHEAGIEVAMLTGDSPT